MQREEAGATVTLALPFPAVEGRGAVAATGLQVSPPSSCQPCRTDAGQERLPEQLPAPR